MGASGFDRRRFLATTAATAATAAVVAFDPLGLGWVATAAAEAEAVPALDGQLLFDGPALAEAAEDYGQIVHRRPRAVLRPGSVADVVTMVRFANRNGIAVAVRGQGHSTFGQAQAGAGLVIDSRTLAGVRSTTADSAVVAAGTTWGELVDATTPSGLTPPVATDYLGLSIGGTLSVGGIGGASSHHGLQVDTALELLVVTGQGELVRCSPTRERRLFEAVLGGLGQYAVIVEATVRLVPARESARVYRLTYRELPAMTAAQRIALADGRFDYLEGQVAPTDTGWAYVLEGAVYHTQAAPDDAAVLAGLPTPEATEVSDHTYVGWLNRVTALVDQLKPLKLANPWVNLFLPDGQVEDYVARFLADLTPAELGGGPILLYPVPRARLTRPMVAVPDTPVVFLFSVLRALAADEATVAALLADNRAAYERARAVGATQYPIGSITTTPADWVAHYGPRYAEARQAKAAYDPRGVLAPGQPVFG